MARRRDVLAKGPVIAVVATAFFLVLFYEFEVLTGVSWADAKQAAFALYPPNAQAVAPSGSDPFYRAPLNEELASLCARTKWDERLIFTCDKSLGGIGNLQNSVLMCVRFAIHAGAALVMPRLRLRGDDITDYKTETQIDLGYMFDAAHFADALRLSCPQMRLFATRDEAAQQRNIAHDPGQLHLPAETLTGPGLVRPDLWRDKFHEWMVEQTGTVLSKSSDSSHAWVINLDRCYMTYPVYDDGPAFANSFSSLLLPREDLRVLALHVLDGLKERFSLGTLDWSQPTLRNAFFGAHLRVERDALVTWLPEMGWAYSVYETQAAAYLDQAESGRSKPKGIYVATGDQDGLTRFQANATARHWTAVDKFDVLAPTHVQALKAMTWDQQAAVDFLVMLKASDFGGVAHSSFSWSLALRRHLGAKKQENYLDAPEKLHDDLSIIYGVTAAEQFWKSVWP